MLNASCARRGGCFGVAFCHLDSVGALLELEARSTSGRNGSTAREATAASCRDATSLGGSPRVPEPSEWCMEPAAPTEAPWRRPPSVNARLAAQCSGTARPCTNHVACGPPLVGMLRAVHRGSSAPVFRGTHRRAARALLGCCALISASDAGDCARAAGPRRVLIMEPS